MTAEGTLGQRLRHARLLRGLSQEKLAVMVGVTRPTVASAEAKGNIAVETLLRFARVLDVSPAYLLSGVEPGAVEQWPPLSMYLHETYGFDADQIRTIHRSVQAFEAEHRLAAMERRIAEEQERDREPKLRGAAYDRPEEEEAAHEDVEDVDLEDPGGEE